LSGHRPDPYHPHYGPNARKVTHAHT
jgi:hypothetical protein